MRDYFLSKWALLGLAGCLILPLSSFAQSDAERLARMEARLLELEQRLAETEQETKEVKVMAASGVAQGQRGESAYSGNPRALDIMAGSAWRNLRWTQEEQWAAIQRGTTEERVVELLGSPPRTVRSMKPRVDEVYFYETNLRDRLNTLRGRISFKDGIVVAIDKPNFQAVRQAN